MYSVERLTYDNYVWAVEVACVKMLLEEVKRPELLNIRNLYVLAEKMITDGTALVVKKDGKPVGVLGALLVPNVYNPELLTLAEMVWYVDVEYRNTRAGALLLNGFIKMAEEMADEATLSLLMTSSVNAYSLKKRGFHQEEMAFRKQIRK